MDIMPKPPEAFEEFVKAFPKIGQAWDAISDAGMHGPLDEKMVRLVKLGIAIGGLREGAVGSGVRKALAAGATKEEILQVVALAASTIGLPSAVAAHSWIRRAFERRSKSTQL